MVDESGFADHHLEAEADEARPRDARTDEAKEALLSYVNLNPTEVWYERQLVVMFEQARRARAYLAGEGFFHWIVVRALRELVTEGALETKALPLSEPVTDTTLRHVGQGLPAGTRIRFFWRRGNRYVARRAESIRKLVMQFAVTSFGRALGQQGEMMFAEALAGGGFMPVARNARTWNGRTWTETDHNFDRIFERDGIAYGAEIKNTLVYIPLDELEFKLRMCEYLGLVPLFIVRMAPKSYIDFVEREWGGFTLVFEWQQYPFGTGELAAQVRQELQLPVDCRARIEDGTVQRFVNWHVRQHSTR